MRQEIIRVLKIKKSWRWTNIILTVVRLNTHLRLQVTGTLAVQPLRSVGVSFRRCDDLW